MKRSAFDPSGVTDRALAGLVRYGSLADIITGPGLAEDVCRTPVHYGGIYHIYLRTVTDSPSCPCCGHGSSRCHSVQDRSVQLGAVRGEPCMAHIRVRRLFCDNSECPRTTFTEEVAGVTARRRYSDAVLVTIFCISAFCSCSATAKICGMIGIDVSHDTVRRLYEGVSVVDNPNVERIGVDDVCDRKGQTYSTAVYDADTHRLLRLLEGRDGKELREWLQRHPKVRVVARDRANAYASAIESVLPECIQCADPFHILNNMIQHLKEIFKEDVPSRMTVESGKISEGKRGCVKVRNILPDSVDNDEFAGLEYDNSPPTDSFGKVIAVNRKGADSEKRKAERSAKRQKRHDLIAAVRERMNGEDRPTATTVAREFGLTPFTVKKYVAMEEDKLKRIPENGRECRRPYTLDGCENIIFKMLRDGYAPEFVYGYVLSRGYSGNRGGLSNAIYSIGRNHFGMHKCVHFGVEKMKVPGRITLSRGDILKYMTITDKGRMKDTDVAKCYELVREEYPAIMYCEEKWNEFHSILMGQDTDALDEFITANSEGRIGGFVQGLLKDRKAITNAMTLGVNSGFVEGCNCKEKLVKRIMYGRAKHDHLFMKVYVASLLEKTASHPRDFLNLSHARKNKQLEARGQ